MVKVTVRPANGLSDGEKCLWWSIGRSRKPRENQDRVYGAGTGSKLPVSPIGFVPLPNSETLGIHRLAGGLILELATILEGYHIIEMAFYG